jgi:LPXTG-motif cell wall-anchored protein
LASNLTSCGLGAFPGGNIGYANRIEGVNDWTDWLGNAAANVIDRAAPILNQAFEAFLGQGKVKLLEAAGYKMLGPVTTMINGVETPGIKAQKRDGSFVIVLKDGNEVPFTTAVAAQTKTVDIKTGLTTGQTAGIAVGVVALAALFFFMSKRR